MRKSGNVQESPPEAPQAQPKHHRVQDGPPCHTAKSIKAWFSNQDICVLDWVVQSCDLNPTKNLWTRLKSIIASLQQPRQTHQEHQEGLEKA